jgi:UDP-N-acetylmuramate dehydrogenase
MLPSGILEHEPLAPYTTLGIGGPARFWCEARAEHDLLAALDFAAARKLDVFILGGGSNLLVSDRGFGGLVIRVALAGVRFEDGTVTAAAGEDWDALVASCVERNWAGIECLSGIPGTVGGTPIQNVGAYGQEASETIESVRVLDRTTSRITRLSNRECGFSYRSSLFNSSAPGRYVVLEVRYVLRVGGEPRLDYADVKRALAARSHSEREAPSLAEVRAAVRAIRASKSMLIVPGDPDARSAGSFFKNPIVPDAEYARIDETARRAGLLAPGESVPRYPAPAGSVKLPAAWLIERSGFSKGYARGAAGISTRHTLALVNRGGATAAEMVGLARAVRDGVRARFAIVLRPEPVFVGFDEAF